MNLPEFGVKKPVTNLMIFSCIIILALYSLTRVGIDSFPKIEPPIISVISVYPGASPADVEAKVTEPLENQLGSTPGIEEIASDSTEGMSVIRLKFTWGTDLSEASNDIRDRIDLAKRFLPDIPDEMENPFMFKFNTSNMPILFMGVTAQRSFYDLYDIIEKRVSDALRQVPGVGSVQIQGGALERQINVWVDRKKLEGYGLSILEIQRTIRGENITLPVGNLKTGMSDYLIRLPGEFSSPDDINLVIIAKKGGKSVYLKDVARVEDSFKEVSTKVRMNGNPGLMLMVQKQSGTNTVEVAERVKKKLEYLQGVLPADVKILTIFDNSKDIITSLNSLKESLWTAIILVVIVVWLFLREIRPSLIVAMTIPFSLMISFVYIFLSGRTINVISLSSLAIVSGMVVDDAIVVVDNVCRKIESGKRVMESSVYGTVEIFLSIAASTLTTVVVFLPMLFIPGVVGIMFGELAVIIIVTMLASLFTATTFTPMLCSRLLKQKYSRGAQTGLSAGLSRLIGQMFDKVDNAYYKALSWCLGRRKTVLLGFTGMFFASLFLARFVGTEFIPEEDSGDIRITINLPIGTRLEETDKVALRVEEMLKKDVPESLIYFVRDGLIPGTGRAMGYISGPNIIMAGAKLVNKTQRKRSCWEVGDELRKGLYKIPGIVKLDVSTGNPIGRMITGGGGKAVQLEIIGHSFEETDVLAEKIKGIMEKTPGTVDISMSRELNRPELRIDIDREKASSLGLSMNEITNNLNTLIAGSTATKYREKGETYDIFVRLEDSSRTKIEDIENISLKSPLSGKQVKLSNFAKIYEGRSPDDIERKNRERVVRVECNLFNRSSGQVVEDIQEGIKKLAYPAGISVNFGGEATEQKKAFIDLTLLLLLGVILVYMVMAAQFESLRDPFIIMFAIPFTFTGVIFAFLLTGMTLNIMSFLGLVMLMGIVVKNAIVLISYINILRARGYSLHDAVTMGGKNRLRPVLMTTLCTIMGLIPLAFSTGEGSESWRPLGMTMLGGLSFSTLITLLYVPTMYSIFEGRKKD